MLLSCSGRAELFQSSSEMKILGGLRALQTSREESIMLPQAKDQVELALRLGSGGHYGN
jgi:hypothetical protein